MYCSKCGKDIHDDAAFCPYCGEPVNNIKTGSNNQTQKRRTTQSESQPQGYQNVSVEQASGKRHRGPIIAGCIAIMVIVIVAVGLIFSSGRDSTSTTTAGNGETGSNVIMKPDISTYMSESGRLEHVALSVFYSDYSPESILTVTFLDTLADKPDSAWDVSDDQDRSVMAWIEAAGEGLYNLYIAADGGVYANPESDHLFYGYSALKSIDFNNCFYTENIINMQLMFGRCRSLETLDISDWNTSKVTDMRQMFFECESLISLDLSNWNTSQVAGEGIFDMFGGCQSLTSLNLNGWDTSQITDMSYEFENCFALSELNITGWDTSQVTDMTQMFYGCESLRGMNLNNLDTSQVTNMSGLFYDCKSLETLEIERWDTGNVTNMQYMFSGCGSLTLMYLNDWNTSKVTNMEGMFSYCSSLDDSLDRAWDTSHVSNMKEMFYNCTSFISVNINSWDISSVTDMSYMFADCSNMITLVMPASFDDSEADKTGITDGTQVEQSEIKTGNAVG